MDRLSANVRRLREGAGIGYEELAGRARLSTDEVQQYERGSGREPRVSRALRLAHSLGTSIDRLLDGIYWDPGEVAPSRARRRAQSERLAGFFLVLSAGRPEVEPAPLREPVVDRNAAARIFAQNLRDARKRRRLTQQALADAAGLSKAGLSLIERGVHETTVNVVFSLARSLQVEPAVLLAGLRWQSMRPPSSVSGRAEPRCPGSVADGLTPATASTAELAARIGSNVALNRHRLGLTQEQLGEAMELERSNICQIEKGTRLPRISMIVKLAASLNLRCEAITAGIIWEPGSGFCVDPREAAIPSPAKRLGENLRRIRVQAGISQEVLATSAAIDRGDVVDIEAAKRTVRILTPIKLAGALDIELAELFAGTRSWYARPLPPPEYAPGDRQPTKTERDHVLTRLWREGKSEREIAEALDLTVAAVGPYVRDLRDAGITLAYRRPPRSSAEAAARRRRRAQPCRG